MREATHEYLRRLVADHKKIDYCTDPYRIAALQNTRIIRANTTAPAPAPRQ